MHDNQKHKFPNLFAGLLLVIIFITSTGFTPPINNTLAPAEGLNPGTLLLENTGQFPTEVRFLLQSSHGLTWFTDKAIWLTVFNPGGNTFGTPGQLRGSHLKLSFTGSNPRVRIEPFAPQGARVSYLTGNEPGSWRSDVPVWGGLRYVDLYPGIDLVLQLQGSGKHQLDWFFEVDKAADLSAIRLRLEGLQEITREVDRLNLITETGDLSLLLPSIVTSNKSTTPLLAYQSSNHRIFQTGIQTFEVSQPFFQPEALADQPAQVLSEGLWYSTYLGGSDWDDAYGLAVDSYGFAYVTGRTPSTDFPVTPGAFQTSSHGVDVFVAKLLPNGNALEYATYVGGSGQDSAFGIAVEDGIAYVVGNTWSSDFPLAGGLAGENDAFVFALNRTGTDLTYTTLLGGEDQDFGNAIAVEAGDVYFTGTTLSPDFPANGYQRLGDAFVARLDPSGALRYASLLSGREDEAGFGIAVQEGEAYVTGQTWSLDFPGGGFKGNGDAFVARFGPEGERRFASLVAGIGEDRGTGILVDADGNSYISGSTNSPDFPAPTGSYRGGRDAFLASFNQVGELQSTVLFGGSRNEVASGISWDSSGGLYLTGRTDSANLPVTPGAYQSLLAGGYDAFLAQYKLGEGFENIETTYLGGTANDQAQAVASDGAGNVYLAGSTESEDFPITADALAVTLSGSQDAFVSRFGSRPLSSPPPTISATAQTPTSQITSTPLAPLTTSQATISVTSQPPQVGDTQVPLETPTSEGTQVSIETTSQAGDTPGAPGATAVAEIASTNIVATNNQVATDDGDQAKLTPTGTETNIDPEDSQDKTSTNYQWVILPLGLVLVLVVWVIYRRLSAK